MSLYIPNIRITNWLIMVGMGGTSISIDAITLKIRLMAQKPHCINGKLQIYQPGPADIFRDQTLEDGFQRSLKYSGDN